MHKTRKILALLITLAMLISVMGVTAFADEGPAADAGEGAGGPSTAAASGAASSSELTDFASVANKEAVSMMVKLGIINGNANADGTYSYNPGDSIERGAAAKIISLAVTLTGGDVPEAAPTFSDSDMWAKNYIEFCAARSIINGTGDGRFDPEGTATITEYAKMVLAAMGAQGLTGAVWQDKTIAAANELGLLEGIDSALDAPVTRDEAALILYRALTASDGGSSMPALIVVKESAETESFTVPANSIVAAPEGKQVTMTIDGVETGIVPGTYENAVLTVTDNYKVENMGNAYTLRAAAYINGGLVEDTSVLSAVISGEVTDTYAADVVINSQNDYFNGIIVDGDTEYTITNPKITLNGHGGDDFAGVGAGIMATGNSKVTVDGAEIHTTGAIRTGIWAGGNAQLLVKNSSVYAVDGDNVDFKVSMMAEVPWILGLKGNLRATNVLDSARVTYLNSKVEAENWGAMSTDSNKAGASLTVINSDIIIYGESGYGSYADQQVQNYYYGSRFVSPDYALIIAAGNCGAVFAKSTVANVGAELYAEIPQENRDEATVVNSGGHGVLWHKNVGGVLSIKEETVFNTGKTVFLIKSDVPNTAVPIIEVENSTLNSESGVILHLMESDDAGMGGGPPGSATMWASEYVVPEVVPVEDGNDTAAENDTTVLASFKDMAVNGNIYNSRWTAGQNLSVYFDNAQVNGVITAGTQYHLNVAPGGKITKATYYELGNVGVSASPVVSSGMLVTLENSSVWTVSGDCYLSSLTIGDGCEIKAASGSLTMTVDGQAVTPEAGNTYTGAIVISAE